MENINIVKETLKLYNCQTAKEISNSAMRELHESITPSAVSAVMRKLVTMGYAASSRDEHGQTKYWLIKEDY